MRLVSSQAGRPRPLVVAAGVLSSGTILSAFLWTAGLTWSLSADGSPPVLALALIWLAATLAVMSVLSAVIIVRPLLVGRLRNWTRAAASVEELAGDVERISQSVGETPSRSELSGQIIRARSQIENRLHVQQRSIDRMVRRMAVGTESTGGRSDVAFSKIGERRPTNVFVLGTGRCGTVTFSAACSHFDNYTAGHESRRGELSAARFAYPDHHIESDNRLSWFLGELGRRFDDDDTLYVHLTRSPEDVVSSYSRRWNSGFRSNIARAFGHGIVVRTEDWPEEEIESVVRFYVETVTANIDAFLEGRQSISIQLEAIDTQFPNFVDRLGATGDLSAATGELQVRHNASHVGSGSGHRQDLGATGPATEALDASANG